MAVVRIRRGRFTLHLSPGIYTLQLLGDGRHVRGRVLQTRHIVVRDGQRVAFTFGVAVP